MRRRRHAPYPPEIRDQVRRDRAAGATCLAVAIRYRISRRDRTSVVSAVTVVNIAHPPETVAAVRADYADGLTLAEIAATHNVTTTTVNRWCNPTKQPRPGQRLLTVAPLLRFLADRQLTPSMVDTQHGINLQRCVRDGGISWVVADRVAVALGCHAFQIWADEWWQAALGDQWDATNEYEETA